MEITNKVTEWTPNELTAMCVLAKEIAKSAANGNTELTATLKEALDSIVKKVL